MTRVAVVYDSCSGHAHERAVAAGAAGISGLQPDALRIESAAQGFAPIFDKLVKCDAVIFGSLAYIGSASAPWRSRQPMRGRTSARRPRTRKGGASRSARGRSGEIMERRTGRRVTKRAHAAN